MVDALPEPEDPITIPDCDRNMLAKIHFGVVGRKPLNWRLPKYNHLWEPDDDEDRPCAQDVIDLLGFNPDDEDWEKDEKVDE